MKNYNIFSKYNKQKQILESYSNLILEKFSDSPLKDLYTKLKLIKDNTKVFGDEFDIDGYINDIEEELIQKEKFDNKDKNVERRKALEEEMNILEDKITDVFDKYIKIHFGKDSKKDYTMFLDENYLYYKEYDKDFFKDKEYATFDDIDDTLTKVEHNLSKDFTEDKIIWSKIAMPADLEPEEVAEYIQLFWEESKETDLTFIKDISKQIDELDDKINDRYKEIYKSDDDTEYYISDIKGELYKFEEKFRNSTSRDFIDSYPVTKEWIEDDIAYVKNLLDLY
jgi:hypothetical protein